METYTILLLWIGGVSVLIISYATIIFWVVWDALERQTTVIMELSLQVKRIATDGDKLIKLLDHPS